MVLPPFPFPLSPHTCTPPIRLASSVKASRKGEWRGRGDRFGKGHRRSLQPSHLSVTFYPPSTPYRSLPLLAVATGLVPSSLTPPSLYPTISPSLFLGGLLSACICLLLLIGLHTFNIIEGKKILFIIR